MPNKLETLGPAETIIATLLAHKDHLVHNRSGYVLAEDHMKWAPVTYRVDEATKDKVVFRLDKVAGVVAIKGKAKKQKDNGKSNEVRLGVLKDTNAIKDGNKFVGEFRPAGVYPEIATWMYQQVAEVFKLDNEFAAKWASYAFTQEHRDLKAVLAAFMLVQSRKGDPVIDAGAVAFYDDDYRDVGEAMVLISGNKGDAGLEPKALLRIYEILTVPAIAKINMELGFAKTDRHPFLGRWPRVITKWLRYREENPKMLAGLVKAGYKKTLVQLAKLVGYKPITPKFFELLRWKQKQADDGRRTIAIGEAVKAATTWEGLTEAQICQRITKTKPAWKQLVGLVPATIGVTRAIAGAAIEAGCVGDKDMIILTPTLEELGLLTVPFVKAKWETAMKNATDMRAANVAKNVRSTEVKEKLEIAADHALQKAVAQVVKGLMIWVIVDISGSMQNAIEAAKEYVSRFLQGFPLEQLHIAAFNSIGKEIKLKAASGAAVTHAFSSVSAGGGTDYGSGIRALQQYKPKADEDLVIIFIGDEEAPVFTNSFKVTNVNPIAFGLLKVQPNQGAAGWRAQTYGVDKNVAVRQTAIELGIPCFQMDEAVFADPYAIPRTIRNMIASAPVSTKLVEAAAPKAKRKTLIETILETPLLVPPSWA